MQVKCEFFNTFVPLLYVIHKLFIFNNNLLVILFNNKIKLNENKMASQFFKCILKSMWILNDNKSTCYNIDYLH